LLRVRKKPLFDLRIHSSKGEEIMSENNGYRPQQFPKPNTIPDGWDFSGLDTVSNNGHHHHNGHKPTGADTDNAPKMETFPKTNTFPGQWDLSGLTD
jgi:hypothetical protein